MKQIEAILIHLKTKGSITPIDALMLFGCFRLGARIFELREQGHNIETERVTDERGKNYARYNYRSRELRQQQFFAS
jgi:hypothetical protein